MRHDKTVFVSEKTLFCVKIPQYNFAQPLYYLTEIKLIFLKP